MESLLVSTQNQKSENMENIFLTLHSMRYLLHPEQCPPDLHHQGWRVCQPVLIMKGEKTFCFKSQTISSIRSPSLRGSKHSKIPDIANQPLNTLLPATKDDSPHSHPFYLTRTAVLSIGDDRPPWDAVTKQVEGN